MAAVTASGEYRMRAVCRWVALAAALTLVSSQGSTQPAGPASPPPATITQPPPAGALPSGAAPATSAPNTSAGARDARPALVPQPGDPGNVDEVILPEKAVLILPGTGDWNTGLKSLREAFALIEAELARRNLAPIGRPLAVFTQTSDDAFRFEAMVPVTSAPPPAPDLPAGMRFGLSPAGKAFRFVHQGAYDEIDTTYETITTYLEVKDIVAKDQFIEEYMNDVSDQADVGLLVNIYVQPR
ncbi:GyrI-like domain-containing protein [uncultured Enterovirga sp.]|uniref:GyrI-like domain-containing protein n=1 Tax=uncultured Enterovirga sp. TaxID=2026352 RepID=UPI0035CA8342